MKDLSVIVPFYNEQDCIEAMHTALCEVLRPLNLDHEIIFVDDGSVDRTFSIAKSIAATDPRLRVIRFRKNYGQTAAMMAGIEHAEGAILITMDGDLQNDPLDIPLFLDEIENGYDVVVGWRHKRRDKLITRKIPSRIANWLIGKVTGMPIKDNGCSLKAYKAPVIKNVPLYSDMHRFIPAILSMTGAKFTEIKVRHHPRRFGISKYGLSRIFKVLSDLIAIKTLVTFTARPLLWFGILAITSFAAGIAALGASMMLGIAQPGTTLVIPFGLSIIFLSLGMFLLLCGLLSELIYRTGSLKIESLARITGKVI